MKEVCLMKRIISVVLAAVISLFAAVNAFAATGDGLYERIRSIPNVILADEFRDSDFAPYEQAQGDKLLTVDLISDTHIGSDGTEYYARQAVSLMNSEKDSLDGVIIPGDLTHTGNSYEFDEFYSIVEGYRGENLITANGNHDYGRWTQAGEMRYTAIDHRNSFMGIDTRKDYYSTELKGCKVVVMGSEGNKPNSAYISDEQLAFVDSELKEGAKDGRPAFVICHWPMRNTHGERISWPIIPGGALDSSTTQKLKSILSKYDNIFYISGHLHAGLNGRLSRFFFRACCVEQHDGITCINVPSLGQGNHLGKMSKGTGMRLTVYSDKAVIEGRDFTTGEWLDRYVYEVSLNNARIPADEPMPALLPEIPPETPDEENYAA